MAPLQKRAVERSTEDVVQTFLEDEMGGCIFLLAYKLDISLLEFRTWPETGLCYP